MGSNHENMKFLLILSLSIAMAACQSNGVPEKSPLPVSIEGTQKLHSIVSGWTNEKFSAETLEYEEFYIFKEDSTFTKFRANGESADGTYSTGRNEDGFFVQTFYKEETSLRESCTTGREYLRLEESGTLVGGSLPCDGPALYYEKDKVKVDQQKRFVVRICWARKIPILIRNNFSSLL